jgi:hypothetical protein
MDWSDKEGMEVKASCEIRWEKDGYYYRMPRGKTGEIIKVTQKAVLIEWENGQQAWYPMGWKLDEGVSLV